MEFPSLTRQPSLIWLLPRNVGVDIVANAFFYANMAISETINRNNQAWQMNSAELRATETKVYQVNAQNSQIFTDMEKMHFCQEFEIMTGDVFSTVWLRTGGYHSALINAETHNLYEEVPSLEICGDILIAEASEAAQPVPNFRVLPRRPSQDIMALSVHAKKCELTSIQLESQLHTSAKTSLEQDLTSPSYRKSVTIPLDVQQSKSFEHNQRMRTTTQR